MNKNTTDKQQINNSELPDDAVFLSDSQAMQFYARAGLNLFLWGWNPIDRKMKSEYKKDNKRLPLISHKATYLQYKTFLDKGETFSFFARQKEYGEKEYTYGGLSELKDLTNKVWGLFPGPSSNIIAIDDDGTEEGRRLRDTVPKDYPFYFPSVGKRNSDGELIRCGTYLFTGQNIPAVLSRTRNMKQLNLDIRYGGQTKAETGEYLGAIFMPGFGCGFKAFNKYAVTEFIK